MRLQGITKQIRILAGVGLLAAGSAQAADTIQAGIVFEHLNPRHTPIPGSLFDLNAKGARAPHWPAINFFGLRLTASLWKVVEPEPGHWDFRRLDRQVAMAQAHGKELLLVLGSTPSWAAGRAGDASCCKPGTAAAGRAAANLNDWRNYVAAVASRYKGRVRYYELGPDARHKRLFSGTMSQLVDMNRIAYQTIKAVDTGAAVVSPGIADPVYLEKYLAAGGGEAADIIGFHFVLAPRAPESMLPAISIVRALMVKYGVSQKPLWNTEARWRPALDALATTHTEERAQAWLARAYVLSWAAGVSRMYWTSGMRPPLPPVMPGNKEGRTAEGAGRSIKLLEAGSDPARPVVSAGKPAEAHDMPSRLSKPAELLLRTVKPFEPDTHNARSTEAAYKNALKASRLAEQAFGNVQDWLVGARMHACAMDFNKTWTCTLTRRNGHPAFILWNAAKKIPFRLPQGWDVSLRSDISGHSRLIRGNTPVNVDWAPVMIEKMPPG